MKNFLSIIFCLSFICMSIGASCSTCVIEKTSTRDLSTSYCKDADVQNICTLQNDMYITKDFVLYSSTTIKDMKDSKKDTQKLKTFASENGKNLSTLINALKDYEKGEYERLKEFGFIARQNKDSTYFMHRSICLGNLNPKEYILSKDL